MNIVFEMKLTKTAFWLLPPARVNHQSQMILLHCCILLHYCYCRWIHVCCFLWFYKIEINNIHKPKSSYYVLQTCEWVFYFGNQIWHVFVEECLIDYSIRNVTCTLEDLLFIWKWSIEGCIQCCKLWFIMFRHEHDILNYCEWKQITALKLLKLPNDLECN